jgi:hypothetical protein
LDTSREGISAATRARNEGVPADPEGAAKTVAAVWLARDAVSVPLAVTGDPETEKIEGSERPTLVTVPGCAPAAIPASLLKSAVDIKPATVELAFG